MIKSDSQIIDDFGGNEAVALICAPTLPDVVSGWRKPPRKIPNGWRRVLMLHSPHLFDDGLPSEHRSNHDGDTGRRSNDRRHRYVVIGSPVEGAPNVE